MSFGTYKKISTWNWNRRLCGPFPVLFLLLCCGPVCTSGVCTGLRCGPSPAPWLQVLDTAEFVLRVTAQKRDLSAVKQAGLILSIGLCDQKRPQL